jgi:hypothetical protein
MSYHIRDAKENEKCDICGEKAAVVIVADYGDYVGYTDEIAYCEECYRDRERLEYDKA